MGRGEVKFLWVMALIVTLGGTSACTTSHRVAQQHGRGAQSAPHSGAQDVRDAESSAVELPPAVQGQDVPATAPGFQTAPSSFGVWIDGVGFDSMAALGFLQELEKAGMRPVKVVGTGFGCWVALSWALENRGTRAEWQSFKWDDFSVVEERGLLGRLRGAPARQRRTETEVRRFLSVANFSAFSIPVDCPYVDNAAGYALRSSRTLPVATALWQQMQIPALGAPIAESLELPRLSGVVAGSPAPAELDEFSRDAYAKSTGHHFRGWIVLRTRTSLDRGGTSDWNRILVDRAQRNSIPASGVTPSGVEWVVVSLADRDARPASELRKTENRRRWLLQGRAEARKALASPQLKTFLTQPQS